MTPNDEFEAELGGRLRRALRAEALRHPLPEDFATTAVLPLEQRSRARWRSTFGFRAAAALLVAVFAFAAIANFLSNAEHGSGSATGSPSDSVGPSGSSQSEEPTALTHFVSEYSASISLDYPSSWRVIASGITVRHYSDYVLVVGTGDWGVPCETVAPTNGIVGGFVCHPDVYTVPTGGIVVAISGKGGPLIVPGLTAPPDSIRLSSGLMATVVDTPTTSVWQIYQPGSMFPWTVEAHFAEPGTDQRRAEVRSLVESIRMAPSPTEKANP